MAYEATYHEEIADEICKNLRNGTNVNVVGMPFSGRTSVLDSVSDHLTERGWTIYRVRGVRALRDRPLSALAVAGVALPASSGSVQALAAAISSLESALSRTPSLLVVDDADDLDETSTGAIAALLARRRIPLLTSERPAGRCSNQYGKLTAAGAPGARLLLKPLSYDGVHRLLHHILGSGVEPTTVARIGAKSGGLPGLVRAMVEHGRQANRLVMRDNMWVARDDLWTGALAASAAALLTGLDEQSIDAITHLAYLGTTSYEQATATIEPEALIHLEDLGLLQAVDRPDAVWVGVFPPLLGEYLTHEESVTRRMRSRRGRPQSAAPVEERPMPEAGGNREILGGEAIMSRRLAQTWRVRVRTAHDRWREDPTPEHAVDLIHTQLVAQARPHEVEAVLANTSPGGSSGPSDALLVVWNALYRALVAGNLDQGRKLLRERQDTFAGHHDLLEACEQYLLLQADSVPPASASRPVLGPGIGAGNLLVVRAETLVASGAARAALDLLDDFRAPTATLAQNAAVTRELALLYTGQIDQAIDLALAAVHNGQIATDPEAIESHGYVAALGLALAGRVVELDNLTSSVLALGCTPSHRPHYRTGLVTMAACAAMWQGRRGYARSLAIQADAMHRTRGPHPLMSADAVSAMLVDGPGSERERADRLWQTAEERFEHGYVPAGIAAAVASVERVPDVERAERLQVAAAACDAPLAEHLADYAGAVACGDPDRLAAMEPRLREAGMRLYAVRTAVAQSIELLESGDPIHAAEQANVAWSQAGLRGRDLCGLFRPFDRAVSLTVREREIAVLLGRGMSAAEIAQSKVLSVRTVENHIFSACRKTGMDTREGLAHAAQTWLSCTAD